MNDEILSPLDLPAVARKKVGAAFDGGRLSSDGGDMLLAQAERRLGQHAQYQQPFEVLLPATCVARAMVDLDPTSVGIRPA